jgi:hypothetical protein
MENRKERKMTQLRIISLSFTVTVTVLLGLYWHAISAGNIAYPADYRKWQHVKTVIVGPQSQFFKMGGGIHHVYANGKAMEGYATGKFPDGAILVFDLLDTKETDGLTVEGARQRIDVMVKDAQRFSASGGWGFERFLGDSETDRPLTEEHRGLCFSCHEQRKTHDFVFSEYRK